MIRQCLDPSSASGTSDLALSEPSIDLAEKLAAVNPSLDDKLLSSEPPYCECAHTSKRALSWLFWLPGFSDSTGYLDRENLNPVHEHISFEQSGDNIGFGPHGLFQEDMSRFEWHQESACYDGSLMRQAVVAAKSNRGYNFFLNNCQDFVARVVELYRSATNGNSSR